MELKKESVIGHGIQFFIVLLVGLILFSEYLNKEYYLLVISGVFFGVAGLSEHILMNQFYSKETNKITKKDRLVKKIKDGFLWVHTNIYYIKKYGTTIYNFKRVGIINSIIPYIIILFYILIVHLFYNIINYYAFAIYLIPVITNIYHFWINHYYVFQN